MREGIALDGGRVAKARQALKDGDGRYMRQSEFAELIGVHPVTMNRIENNKAKVSLETLELLCEQLSRSREHLMGLPEEIDELNSARDRVAKALSKLADGYADFGEAVEALNDRVKEIADARVPS